MTKLNCLALKLRIGGGRDCLLEGGREVDFIKSKKKR